MAAESNQEHIEMTIETSYVICDALAGNDMGTLVMMHDKMKKTFLDASNGEASESDVLAMKQEVRESYPGHATSIKSIRNKLIIYTPKWMVYNDDSHAVVRAECEIESNGVRCFIESYLVSKSDDGYDKYSHDIIVFRGDLEYLYDSIIEYRSEIDDKYNMIIEEDDIDSEEYFGLE